ncbi:DUF4153 domain-containing protein [Arsenicitalea aurantiaca]|uniref:DUF4153 domain-containing protein n=1 Tax=Arsenicitalea aurantiaca TaxID=1783274 RepID=A0A433XFE9_9HYPH|nr:DUF4153 domain-containing protein [Arsenicitalea aurantiaca]RUT32831.1 DUF4153 domain-containing protein [Arsenicitalea aurantiaca]
MSWRSRFALAPDALATLWRFPLPVVLAAIAAAILVGVATGLLSDSDDFWPRAVLGLGVAFLFGTAGVLYRESRPYDGIPGPLLAFVLPPLAGLACLPLAEPLIAPYVLPVIAVLWLSVSAFTRIGRGSLRAEQQDRFWWLNHQGATTAILAIIAFLLVALGMVAIERSLAILFGLETRDFFYDVVLPVVGAFLAPVYWLTTLPRLDAYDPNALRRPDFLARAVGFLGQFILAPVLFAYAGILLAYTVQIAVTGTLPQGMLGWMVLGYVVSGAATYLLLHPAFMRERALVRLFRRIWFWLTLVPLGLFAVAVWIRVDAYGLTSERIFLVAGGVWAALLAAFFILRRGDIRLIPAIAAIILALISVGPWSYENAPRWDQSARLERLLVSGGITGPDSVARWTVAEARAARSAMTYLAYEARDSAALREVLARHGVAYDGARRPIETLLSGWGVPDEGLVGPGTTYLSVDRQRFGGSVDVSRTPHLVGAVQAGDFASNAGPLAFRLTENRLQVRQQFRLVEIDLADWVASQHEGTAIDPVIDFLIGGTRYRIALDSASIELREEGDAVARRLTNLAGTLFSERPLEQVRPSPEGLPARAR